jgi:hypothetical protein
MRKKVGYKSITAGELRKGDHFLIREQNAVLFDPNAGWKEGDLIPDYVISRQDAKGSAARQQRDRELERWEPGPLSSSGRSVLTMPTTKRLKRVASITWAFAVHDDNITTRGHHVSFVKTLGIGAKADIQAVKLP